VWLTDVYPAGEAPIAGADAQALLQALQAGGTPAGFTARVADLPQALAAQAQAGDVLITMGAGSIGQVPKALKSLAVTAQ
jgi:UDP-N-acetylmuramate--alanine ligase